jgi:hypothetical protein
MWIHSFLCDRKQRVVVNGYKSNELAVTSGVPQGSVLGPTLFLVYINDLPQKVDCNISLFADDTLIYQVVNSSADKRRFQNNIDALEMWAHTWKMLFNVAKCSVMTFNQRKESPQADYTLAGVQLEVVDETKYLGVVLQSNLKFNSHIAAKTCRARQQLGMIKRVLYDAPEKAKLIAYTSLCRPHVEYACTVWDPSSKSLQHDLEMIQNNAIRFICKIKGRESITTARDKLHIQTLSDRRKNSRQTLLLRLLSSDNNHGPLIDTYDELMSERLSTTITRAAGRGDPPTIYAKTSIYHNSFLPKTVRELKSTTL